MRACVCLVKCTRSVRANEHLYTLHNVEIKEFLEKDIEHLYMLFLAFIPEICKAIINIAVNRNIFG